MKKIAWLILLLVASVCLTARPADIQLSGMKSDITRDPTGPYNLQVQLLEINDVLLIWENPVYVNLPMGYRIYCNGNMVRYIPGANVTDCLLEDICEGCHQFYVTAYYDTGCESTPSNIAEIMITSDAENTMNVKAQALKVYPCPARYDVSFSLQGGKTGAPATVGIYNLKGQLLRQYSLTCGETKLWDRKDSYGKTVSEGIYYLKADTAAGSLCRKLTLLK